MLLASAAFPPAHRYPCSRLRIGTRGGSPLLAQVLRSRYTIRGYGLGFPVKSTGNFVESRDVFQGRVRDRADFDSHGMGEQAAPDCAVRGREHAAQRAEPWTSPGCIGTTPFLPSGRPRPCRIGFAVCRPPRNARQGRRRHGACLLRKTVGHGLARTET